MFSKDELNVLGLIVAQAPIKGSDAAFIAALLAKIERMTKEPEDVQFTPVDSENVLPCSG